MTAASNTPERNASRAAGAGPRPPPAARGLPSSSRGVALVMVLGVLSVMVIMAVAFAISMRTERVAAGNYADGIRARQLVHVGLARALNYLAVELGPDGLRSAPGGTSCPAWLVTNSLSYEGAFTTNAYSNTSIRVSVLVTPAPTEATNYIPRALLAAATNADVRNAPYHWIPIDRLVWSNNVVGGMIYHSNRLGRVKYLIVNCSGLLDANYAGGADRQAGARPVELSITNMTEFRPPVSTNQGAPALLAARDARVRFETQAELAALNASAFWTAPSNFTVYSCAPVGRWDADDNEVGALINLAGSVTDLVSRESAIVEAFKDAGFAGDEAGCLFTNLLEYVDEDSIPGAGAPQDTDGRVEKVPMINEIAFSSSDDGDNECQVEVWYPFADANPQAAFNLAVEYTVLGLNGSVENEAQTFSQTPLNPNQLKKYSLPHAGQKTNAPYGFTLTKVELQCASNSSQLFDAIRTFPARKEIALGGHESMECIDPRFNGNMTDPSQWAGWVAPSLEAVNNATKDWWTIHADCDGHATTEGAMHVANRPLRSIGELGHLCYATWKTVKLYGPDLDPVLDYFILSRTTNAVLPEITNEVWRGQVNPNSRQREVLATVFRDMPIDDYAPTPTLRVDEAGGNAYRLADQLMETNVPFYPYTNLSDIGRALTDFSAAALPGLGMNLNTELRREGLVRNSCGLFSVRQNLFTVVIEAHVASGGGIPRNPIRQRAVALVWRDPYTGELVVRHLRWLDD